jgi:hypothetical protein
MKQAKWLTLALLAATATTAQAGVIFAIGNDPQTDEPVLYHDSCVGCIDGPAFTVVGHTQSTNILVDLTSNTPLTAVGPGHNTVSTDAGFNNLAITMPGYSFESLILQLTSIPSATDGTVTFTAHTLSDGTFVSPEFFDDHTGGNYFTITITAAPGSLLTEVDLVATQLQHDISQIRIGGATANTPEPATLAMLGIAFISFGVFGRKLQKH